MKRGLIILSVFLVIIAAIGAVVFFGLGFWLSPQDTLRKSDAIVAISGGETTSRAEEAVKLYKDGWAPLIIFSGAAADPNGPSNAKVMQELAIKQGVPSSAIVIEEASTNTTENAKAVSTLATDLKLHQIILVTSPYHQRRASVTFERALGSGVKIINHSTTDQMWRRSDWWATPYSRQLTWSELGKTLYVIITNRVSS